MKIRIILLQPTNHSPQKMRYGGNQSRELATFGSTLMQKRGLIRTFSLKLLISLPQVCVCEEGEGRGTAAGAALLKMFTLRMLLPKGQTLNPPILNSWVTK